MVNDLPYILEKGSKKHHCPGCEKKRLVRYVEQKTGNLLPEHFGRCDREINCGYHLNPYNEAYNPEKKPIRTTQVRRETPKKIPLTFFPLRQLRQTRKAYDLNVFFQNLLNGIPHPIDPCHIEKTISLYNLGTISQGYRKGALTIPFIDQNENVRAIQVKQFDNTNHTTSTGWLHSMLERHYKDIGEKLPSWLALYLQNETKVSCLFGEHLIKKFPNNPVALVEAPKTAIYGTIYFGLPKDPDQFIWLAVYNLSSLNLKKCNVLAGRSSGVYLFPDLSKNGEAFKRWKSRADEFANQIPGTKFYVSDFLERNATQNEKESGFDLADFLIQHDYRSFIPKKKQSIKDNSDFIIVDLSKSSRMAGPIVRGNDWDQRIKELETFFSDFKISHKSIELNAWTRINNIPEMIQTHLATTRRNNSNRIFKPYLDRLELLKSILMNKGAQLV